MGVSLSIGSLLARTPPTIVITEPLPRWKALVQRALKLLGLLLACALSFLAGMYYEQQRPRQRGQVPAAVQPAATPAERQPAPAAAPVLPRSQELLEPRVVDGLSIQTLDISADDGRPGQLRYQFSVANEGRLYEGQMEFVVLGELDGRPQLWRHPPGGAAADPKYQMRVGRYVKSEGRLQLPAGFTPQVITLRLREGEAVRASRGMPWPQPAMVRGR